MQVHFENGELANQAQMPPHRNLANHLDESQIQIICSMGFNRNSIIKALQESHGNTETAINLLVMKQSNDEELQPEVTQN